MRTVLGVLLAAALSLPSAAPAQTLVDAGPFWAGISDTTSLGERIRANVTDAEALLGAVRAVEGERTAGNTLHPLVEARTRIDDAFSYANAGRNLHPDSAFRAYASAWVARLDAQFGPLDTDLGVQAALAALDTTRLGPVERYVVRQDLAAYRRRGVALGPEAQARATALRAQIRDVGERFAQNTYPQPRTLRVHPDSLEGLPPDWVAANASGPPGEDGRIEVVLSPPDAQLVLTSAENPGLRARAERVFLAQGDPENLPLIDSLRTLRHELADLLGFESWAHYMLSSSMAGSPARVARFLDEVDRASEPAARSHAAALLAAKREGDPDAVTVASADEMYFTFRLAMEASGVDPGTIRAYLPYAAVRDGVLDTFGEVFGLAFRAAPETPVWSAAAEAYDVLEDGALVGRVVLDMHPREGKFGHCAQFTHRSGGGRVPEVAVACNLPGGAEGGPGLLMPHQVQLFFHEVGHAVHGLFAGRRSMRAASENDFREAPSKLFEAWALDPAVLGRFARHHETGAPLPPELLEAYLRVDAVVRTGQARQTLLISALDLALFSAPPEADPTADVERRVLDRDVIALPSDYRPAANIPHLYHYGTNYYTYLWSDVIARDLLTGFDRDDLLSPEAGRRYRDLVLARTGTAPSGELVQSFLGRPFDARAWRARLTEDVRD